MAETPSPIEIQKHLSGVDYPASKATIVQAAEDQGADDQVLDALGAIPDREYDSPTAVSSAVAS